MKRSIIVLVLIMALLAACNPAPAPRNTPARSGGTSYPPPAGDTQVGSTPYPGPNPNSSTGTTPYPGPGNSSGTSSASPYPDPLQPIPGEEKMERGNVFIDESSITTLESAPPRYELHIVGNLPTPCHKLRAKLSQPDAQNQIQVEVYSLVNPDEICTQVLSPFDTNISLGSFPTGKYIVLVNGEKVGEIDAP